MGVIRTVGLICLLLLPPCLLGQLSSIRPFYVAGVLVPGGGSAGDPCTGCTNETFEGTGYSIAGWTEAVNAGIVDEDYTTAPAPLTGSQSLLVKDPADSNSSYTSHFMPSSGEMWIRFSMIITNTIVNGIGPSFMVDNVFTVRSGIEIRSSALRVTHGTANATTVSTLTAGTRYYVWFHYLKGTGANGVADVGFSTGKTRPTGGNGFAQVTTGTSTQNITDVAIGARDVDSAAVLSGIIFDDVSITTLSQPGDFP